MTKLRTTLRGAAVAGCLACFLSNTAFAAFKPTAAQRADCMGDAISLCAFAIPNTDRIVTCLAAKKSQLSTSCRAHFNAP
jgi:hypothetical protein